MFDLTEVLFQPIVEIAVTAVDDLLAKASRLARESGQIVESDLPHSEDSLVETIQLQPVSAGSEENTFPSLCVDSCILYSINNK